jgi:hypothetical protein
MLFANVAAFASFSSVLVARVRVRLPDLSAVSLFFESFVLQTVRVFIGGGRILVVSKRKRIVIHKVEQAKVTCCPIVLIRLHNATASLPTTT